MKSAKLIPMLWTENLDESIDFYTTILEFECGERNSQWGWASLHNGDIDIMLAKPNEHTPFEKTIFTGSFYFRVDNVEELYEQLKSKVKIAYPIENFEWDMREFAIYDCNGYMLQFGQEIADINKDMTE